MIGVELTTDACGTSVVYMTGLQSLVGDKNGGNNNKRCESVKINMIDFRMDSDSSEDDLTIDIGDFVTLSSGQVGEVKFVGEVEFAKGEMLGLEMQNWDQGQTDGSKAGKRYFRAASGRGKFTRARRVKSVLNLAQIKEEMEEKYGEKFEFDPFQRDVKTGKLIDPQAFLERYIESQEKKRAREQGQSTKYKYKDFRVGQIIELYRGRLGTIRYIGDIKFVSEPVLGIELHKFRTSAHDGKGYFTTKGMGYGEFVTPKDVVNIVADESGNENNPNSDPQTQYDVNEEKDVSSSQMNDYNANNNNNLATIKKVSFWINDRVRLANGRTGIVRWQGLFSEEVDVEDDVEHVGIELDVYDAHANAGTKYGYNYFTCPPNRGVFVLPDEIVDNLGNCVKRFAVPQARQLDKKLEVGDKIEVLMAGVGTIKYVGKTPFDGDNEMIGLELDRYNPNYSDGKFRNEQLFDVSQGGCGYIAKPEHIMRIVSDTAPESQIMAEKRINQIKIPKLNDRCRLIDGSTGVVRFIGHTEFGRGIYIGVSLDSFSHNARNGVAKGKKYFRATPGKGFFVKLEDLVDNLGSIIDTPMKSECSSDCKISQLLLKIGDKVRLHDGSTAAVKFIGDEETDEDQKGEVIGLDLDQWSVNAGDGQLKGKKYFLAAPGRGLFVCRTSVASLALPKSSNLEHLDILPFKLVLNNVDDCDDDSYSYNYKGYNVKIGDTVKLTHGRIGEIQTIFKDSNGDIVCSIFTNKWKSTISDDCYELQREGYITNYNYSSDSNINRGETIELRGGQIGTVRYIGPVHFADGEWIGVELHSFLGYHDGCVGDIRYFSCPPKRGKFVKIAQRKTSSMSKDEDDPVAIVSREYLNKRCPECNGEFIKFRNPQSAYHRVGIVCDGCHRGGNTFSKNDWYFQCVKCEQIDYCLNCLLLLDTIKYDHDNDNTELQSTNSKKYDYNYKITKLQKKWIDKARKEVVYHFGPDIGQIIIDYSLPIPGELFPCKLCCINADFMFDDENDQSNDN